MSAHALLSIARSNRVSLSLTDEGTLRYSGPRRAVEQLLPQLKQYQDEIKAVLAQADETERAFFDRPGSCASTFRTIAPDRAAILDPWFAGVARLKTMRLPNFTAAQWQQLLDDAEYFVDRWAEQAAALGWTTLELFGAHPLAPYARQDAKGLLIGLDGDNIENLSADCAVLHSKPGSRLTFYRPKSLPVETTPIWSLR